MCKIISKNCLLLLNNNFFHNFFWSILIGNTFRILPKKGTMFHHLVMDLWGHQSLLMHLAIDLSVFDRYPQYQLIAIPKTVVLVLGIAYLDLHVHRHSLIHVS